MTVNTATATATATAAHPGNPAATEAALEPEGEVMVSLRAEVPEALLVSMRQFIDHHPNWDQYRLFQAALAGFLVQNGTQTRAITRCYLANLFPSQARFRCG